MFREYININTIRGKFFWLTTTLVVIPMVILSTIFYNITADKFGSKAKNQALASLNMADLYMDQVISDVNDLTNVILGNQELQAILAEKKMDDYAYLRNVDKVSKIMNVYTQSKPFITSYLIYSKNGIDKKHFYRGTDSITFGSRNMMSPEKANSYYKDLLTKNAIMWINKDPFGNVNEEAYSQMMVVVKLLKKTGGNFEDLGFVMLEIDKDAFFKGLQFLNPTEQSQLFVWDDRGELMYHMPRSEDPIREHEIVDKLRHQKFTTSKQQVLGDDKKYFGASVINERTGWSMISMIEDSKLLEDANEIGDYTIQTFLFVLIIGWIFALLFGNSIRRPLSMLRSMMVVNQYLPSLHNYQFNADDEVSQIGERFLRMMEENRKLNDQVYDALLKRKEAEIQVLQAQINPHFLYNTLESLNGFAVSNNQPEMSEVIGALGKFFRITLNRGNDLITVADEVEHVTAYVKVQQFRFKGKFEWICEVDEEMAQYMMPKLLLQPLVENAIHHGLKGRSSPGMIMLSGELSETAIKFSVSDDGPGIPDERLREIVDALTVSESGKIYGLKNVHDRIHLRFDIGYGLEIKSEAGKYTTVSIRIPLLDKDGKVIGSTTKISSGGRDQC
ncbi:sensor histidine kinase [Paenibacillus alkaliterrae]|uniref:sensor histidine kinase n=1 Tax=Paenibacillus alkaliterrae TaxID=320909 RepID=UPI001F2E7A12|nr:sensor histidine kinase [Paenibacillus alkaliterrae]MCF2940849.1 sensor histidine kinase [Paenibacillus alkaliterrae]